MLDPVREEWLDWIVRRIKMKFVVVVTLWLLTLKNLAGTGSLLPRNTQPTTVQENVHLSSCKSILTHISFSRQIQVDQQVPVVLREKCLGSPCCTLMTTTTSFMVCYQGWLLIGADARKGNNKANHKKTDAWERRTRILWRNSWESGNESTCLWLESVFVFCLIRHFLTMIVTLFSHRIYSFPSENNNNKNNKWMP